MNAVPAISVILTVYNGEAFIQEAVQSILAQTFQDFEFIIVDNASTDQTIPMLRCFRDSRIRLLPQEVNLGQTRALNVAVQEARGRYLARMDADDCSLSERLSVQFRYMETHPKAAVVGCWHEEVSSQGNHLKVMRYPTDAVTIRCHMLSDGDLTRRCFSHPTAFMRRAAVIEAGGYNSAYRYAQDYDLWTRVLSRYEIHNVPQVLLRYRVSPGSGSQRYRGDMNLELDRIVEENIRRIWMTIPEAAAHSLQRMLRNKPLIDESAASVCQEFDEFFSRAIGPHAQDGEWVILRERIKFYYLPYLITSNPLYGIAFWIRRVIQYPEFIWDIKFLKNTAKRCLNFLHAHPRTLRLEKIL